MNRPPGAGGFAGLPHEFKSLLFPDTDTIPPSQCSSSGQASKVIKLCRNCMGEIAKGVSHKCSKGSMRDNLAELVKSRSKKSKAKITGRSLKSVFDDQTLSYRGGTATLPTGGTPVQVTMGDIGNLKVTKKSARWSHKDLKRLQSSMNLSDRSIK